MVKIGCFVGRPWPAPEKILKSLRYWANVQYRHIGSKGHNGNPGSTYISAKHPLYRLNIRGSAFSTRAHASGEISPHRRSSFQCGRVYVQSMDDSSDRLYGALEVGLRRGTRSGPVADGFTGRLETAAENCSLWFGEACARLREKSNCVPARPSI